MKRRMIKGLMVFIMAFVSLPAMSLDFVQDKDLSATFKVEGQSFDVGDKVAIYYKGFREINVRSERSGGVMLPFEKKVAQGIVTKVLDNGEFVAQFDRHLSPEKNRLSIKKLRH